VTNVFNFRPKRNDVMSLCGPKKQAAPDLPPLARGRYLRAEYSHELDRLYSEIREADPTVIIAFGATASWAFTGEGGIRKTRGVTSPVTPRVAALCGERKVVPTYHPAAVMRQWTLRPLVIADCEKANRQSEFREFIRPQRRIYIEPTISDLLAFEEQHFAGSTKLACDIETKQEQITCIGFAPDPSTAIVIPFFCNSGANYWSTKEEELEAWNIVRRWCRDYPTVFQNGLYDMNFLWRVYGIPCPKACDDTMLLHHALQPEMEKGLGFLASLYTDEPSWKHMRKGLAHD
jgi:hypothetical protein